MIKLTEKQIATAKSLYGALNAEDTTSLLRFSQRTNGPNDWALLSEFHLMARMSLDQAKECLSMAIHSEVLCMDDGEVAEQVMLKLLSTEWDAGVYSFLKSGINPVEHLLARIYKGNRSVDIVGCIGEETLACISSKGRVRLHRSHQCSEVLNSSEHFLGMVHSEGMSDDQVLDRFLAVAFLRKQAGMYTYKGSSDVYGMNRFLGAGAESYKVLTALTTSDRVQLTEELLVHSPGSPMHTVATRRLQGVL